MFRKKGFTLIELIMVIVIIGILAAIAIPKFINLRRDAQKASCKGSAGAIQTALSNYYARKAISGTAAVPATLHDPEFIKYLQAKTLPDNPVKHGHQWDTWYHTTEGANSVVDSYTFSIDDGACTF